MVFGDYEYFVSKDESIDLIQKSQGTFGYIPPECLHQKKNYLNNLYAQDFFAVGMTIIFLLNPSCIPVGIIQKINDLYGKDDKNHPLKDLKDKELFSFVYTSIKEKEYYNPLTLITAFGATKLKKDNIRTQFDLFYCTPELTEDHQRTISNFIKKLTAFDPDKRPTDIKEIQEMADIMEEMIKSLEDKKDTQKNISISLNI